MNKKQLYICHTPYHILVTCEYALRDRSSREAPDHCGRSILLLDCIDDFESYAERLRKVGLFDHVFVVRHSEVFAPWTNTSFYKTLLLLYVNRAPRRRLGFIFDFDDVFIFNDHRDMGAFLHRYHVPYHLLEDGRDCFKRFDQNNLLTANRPLLRKALKRLFDVPIGMGDSPFCQDIRVNSNDGLMTHTHKPLIEDAKDALAKQMSELDREVLGEVFPVPAFDSARTFSVLVLTSPMEAHGEGWTEEKQRAYYRAVIEGYSNAQVFLKPHPRDEVDYGSMGDICYIIDKNIPVEVLDLNRGILFDCAVAYLSTALPSLRCCKCKISLYPGAEEGGATIKQGD